MVSVLQEPLKILKKGGNIPESNLKVQVRVRVKAKCVVKRLSVEGVWKRDQNGQAGVSMQPWWGSGGGVGGQSSAFYQADWARPRAEWRGRESPDFLSSCWNAQAFWGGEE